MKRITKPLTGLFNRISAALGAGLISLMILLAHVAESWCPVPLWYMVAAGLHLGMQQLAQPHIFHYVHV